jgi:predicted Zn finger-like uncharacterized protein
LGLYNLASMSLITRCPACQTAFKVVPDQLRMSQGWVRCGQCQEIFDGNANLLQVLDAVQDAARVGGPVAPTPIDIEVLGPAANPVGGGAASKDQASAASAVDETLGVGTPIPNREPEFSRALIDPVFDEPPTVASTATADAGVSSGTFDDGPALADPASPASEAPTVSFMRPMPKHSVWRRPLIRATLGLVALVLTVALTLQVIYRERDLLATLVPQIKPYLVQACGYVDCKILPHKQIDAMVMESSSLSALGGDGYRLEFVIKNTSALDLAVPALELTLTDSQDLPVIRRVLLPVELGASFNELAAGKEWPGSVAISVRAPTNGQRIAGYRAATLYP